MLLFCLILAHLIADFYLQTDEMVKDKINYIKKHIGHHFLMNGLVLIVFYMFNNKEIGIINNLIILLLFIGISHYFIDFLKIKLQNTIKFSNEENLNQVSFFIIDQLLHLVCILLAGQFFLGIDLAGIHKFFLDGEKLSTVNAVLFTLIVIIFATTVSGYLIKILLGSLPNQLLTFEGKYTFKNERQEALYTKNYNGNRALAEEYNYTIFGKHDLSRGKLIGYLERLLVLVLTFYSAYPAIGFIVAAKSIARFKQMDDRNWAEYFLLGTLTSMFIGITLGILLREVLT
ncbi:DUF3307 domain-containing protein [Bacillus sp. EB106-08-02-XG196]|uniref:DUF3307 domain-containing protein n=1 Tax=Bacillus sp. EB106-08-02-XG196 TaxID=2737049 RepID=UPI0015C46295|nr:DUF3307 domain-containing protein [Bacillus sp. EB106-08-02-XG196]NWQ43724.1 DUF3307 domain-containing protein [Bacillus sp. EB106-08-02-XG196]